MAKEKTKTFLELEVECSGESRLNWGYCLKVEWVLGNFATEIYFGFHGFLEESKI
jgi:hypothetical protein